MNSHVARICALGFSLALFGLSPPSSVAGERAMEPSVFRFFRSAEGAGPDAFYFALVEPNRNAINCAIS